MRLPVFLVLIVGFATAAVTICRTDDVAAWFTQMAGDSTGPMATIGAHQGAGDKTPEAAAIDVAFTPRPEGSAQRLVIKAIESAHHTIEVAAYEFTSKPIADALIRAAGRGVKVHLVADAKENDVGGGFTRVDYAAAGGVSARIDDVYAIMHNKFLVVDEETIETGSFNYTHGAGVSNAENVVVLWHRHDIAALYVKRFRELWDESRPVGSQQAMGVGP